MHRDYPYRGHVINVAIEVHGAPAISGYGAGRSGCLALVRIYRPGELNAVVGPIRVVDRNGRWFASEAEALLAGGTAGQRAVDDLSAGLAAGFRQ